MNSTNNNSNANANANVNVNANTNAKYDNLSYNFKPSKVKSRLSKRHFKKTPPTKVIIFEQVPMYDRWANGG